MLKKSKHQRKSKKANSHKNTLLIHKCNDKINNHTADAQTHFILAAELNKRGDIMGALKNYKKGLKRNPNDNTALIYISLILIGLSEFAQAISYLSKAIAHTPVEAIAYIYRSLAYLGAGKKTEAYLDFKFIYENHPDFIRRFTNMDNSVFPQIDFEEAMAFCLKPDATVKPWPWPEVYFPTEDCPDNEICLQKDFCLQQDVCPQNDISNFKDLITKPNAFLPEEQNGLDMDEVMASPETAQPAIFSDLPVKIHSLFGLHGKINIRKLMRFYIKAKHRLISVFNFAIFSLILPFNEILVENLETV